MGIPAFYRWLTDRFPLAVSDVVEESPVFVNGVQVPMDTSQPNPNGLEFDNLYLDMNGIIHPCFHPEGLPAPKTYEEVFMAVFNFIDRLFSIVRPRKLLYMAIDGVAPRAKMNQQRARRFRTAKEAEDAASGEERLRSVLLSEEEKLVALEQTKALDSNVITPGTEFMASLSSALRYYIHLRMNTDPGWRGLKVILSDANVPGEGEHKIMSYIRLQRNMPGFDPNTRHCLYGLDADLIMLALATHEIHFSILREDVRKSQQNDRAPKSSNYFTRLSSKDREMKAGEMGSEYLSYYISKQNFQFLNIWVLRDYLMHDMRVPDSSVKTDLERLIDDFVFMCIFVGNDFLPHVPSLNIHEGAIDLLMDVYKKEFARMGGYLTHSFEVNLERVQHFVQVVGANENAIFRKRSQVQKEREKQFLASSHIKHGRSEPCSSLPHAKKKNKSNRFSFWPFVDKSGSKCSDLKNPATKDSSGFANKAMTNGENVSVDNIKLGEEGWKERFYSVNFEANTEAEREKIRSHAVLKYIEGICWVMHYYYQGVCSWQWFYPYHYAPFASDFYGLDLLEIHFILGEPFKPFDQLMGVLPAASAHALPLFYRKLMTDASSPISDFYPTDFELDMNGKKFTWQAICKLPFIKESHLLAEIAKVEHTLTDEEMRRNALGLDVLFVHITHTLATKIFSFCKRNKDHPKLTRAKIKRKIDPEVSGGMNGYIYISDKPVWPLEVSSPIEDMEIITMNKAISVFYRYPPSHPHIPRPPEGVVMPQMSVSKNDVMPAPVLWHEKSTVIGRLFSKRLPARAISGSRLAKSAHRLVLKHYLENKQKDVGPAELDGHVTVGASSWSNSKEMLPEGKIDNGKRNCMTDSELEKSKQHKRQKVETNLSESLKVEIDNGHNIADIRNQSNSKEMVLESAMEDGERKMNGSLPEENKIRKMQASLLETPPAEFDSHDIFEVPCQSNSKDTALESKVEDGERSRMIDSKAGQNMEPIGQNNLVEELVA